MEMVQRIYPFAAMVYHHFTAWNSGGEGIHSPYLFEWVRMILTDKNAYYCWKSIETNAHRRTMSEDAEEPDKREARVLFRLINWLEAKEQRALNIVQWGVGHGIASAYMASVGSKHHIYIKESDNKKAEAAHRLWKSLGLTTCCCCLDNKLQVSPSIDVSILTVSRLDAMDVLETTIEKIHAKSVIAVLGLRCNPISMQRWKQMKQHNRVTSSMDLGRMGLLFFDPHYIRKHYKLRI